MSSLTLLHKVLSFKLPARALGYALLHKVHSLAGTGQQRYQLERLYLENPDPWNYHVNPYEADKYARTLEQALKFVAQRKQALEVGCSVGIFTRMVAKHFDSVTASDISAEAIRICAKHPASPYNARFLAGDFRTMNSDQKYDAIFCAEVLYYFKCSEVDLVCTRIEKSLAADGVLVIVTGTGEPKSDGFYSEEWHQILASRYHMLSSLAINHAERPYRISVYRRALNDSEGRASFILPN